MSYATSQQDQSLHTVIADSDSGQLQLTGYHIIPQLITAQCLKRIERELRPDGRLRLTRARGESIRVGPDLELHVTRVAPSRVLLALYMNSAPNNNGIHLSDLFHCTKGDRVCLAPGITCESERVGGTHVQLVIEAPRQIHIRRAELSPRDQLIA